MKADITRICIAKHITKDRVLDVTDMLNLESKRSQVCFTLIEFDDNYKAKERVRAYVPAADIKLICHDIVHGVFSEWTHHEGIKLPPAGMVMSGVVGDDLQGLTSRVITIRKDIKYRQPYVLKIDNGEGQELPDGNIKMARATAGLTILLPEWEMRRFAMTVIDYVRDWETVNFRRRQEAQTIILPVTT